MKIFGRRHEELDARVADARARAATAEEEIKVSRGRQQAIRQNVIAPLRKAGEHNQFAELLRASIIAGHGNGVRDG